MALSRHLIEIDRMPQERCQAMGKAEWVRLVTHFTDRRQAKLLSFRDRL